MLLQSSLIQFSGPHTQDREVTGGLLGKKRPGRRAERRVLGENQLALITSLYRTVNEQRKHSGVELSKYNLNISFSLE